MPRPIDPDCSYRFVIHNANGHSYASVQRTVENKAGKKVRRHKHYGTVSENKFYPWAEFLILPKEEKAKFIYPEEWDISLVNQSTNNEENNSICEIESQNRLYGDIWLLEQIAEKTQIRRDLSVVFDGNIEMIDAIMTLAMFPYITKYTFNRVERWQRTVKTPCDFPLTPKMITTITQKITERHRTELLSLRAARLDKNELCAVDSTSISTYGDTLTDIRWGRNKEHLPLEQINSVVVYTLSSHLPVYYKTFPGNMPDSRSLDVILKDLDDSGFKDIAIITDRGYESLKNLEKFILDGRPMLMSIKVAQKIVMDVIKTFGVFDFCPEQMTIDPETELAYYQTMLDYELQNTDGKKIKAKNLRLNLYLNVKNRTTILLKLRIELERQKQELTNLLNKKTILETIFTPKDDLDDDEPQSNKPLSKDIKKKYGYYNIFFDVKTKEMKSFELNQKAVDREKLLAGFFANITNNLDFTAMEAFHHYKLRDEQEKYFEQMKDQMVADRLRCWTEESSVGRQFILFISMVLGSQIRHVWRTKLKDSFSSSLEILDEMRSIRYIERPGHTPKITPFVGAQLDICQAFGFTIPSECDVNYVSMKVKEKKKVGRPRKKQ